MRKTLSTVAAGLAVFLALSGSAASGAGLTTLKGHVPAAVAQLTANGALPADTNLTLAIGLPVRNKAALSNLLEQIYDPASPNYQKYLTPDEFTTQFGPTEREYQAVKNFAAANGLTVVGTHPNRMLLDVTGKVSDIQNAFHVTLRTYHHPSENRDFYAPDTEPMVPSDLSIQDISGLDNFRRPHSHYKIKPVSKQVQPMASGTNAAPKLGSGPGGTYMGDDFRNAYVPGTSLNGSSQAIALVQFDGYLQSDINTYEALVGRTNIPLQNVLIDGFSGVPTGNGGEVEVSLDIEMAVSMAPALAKIIVYEGDPFNFHPNDVLNAIATDNSARQISCSWGWRGGPSKTTDQIFQQMAVQGQTFFVAAGDSDAYPPGTVDNPFGFGTPADSPYLTSVGGTTLTMKGQGAVYSSETVWNWGTEFGEDGVGSSGGTSSTYAIPSWQTNVNMTAAGGSTTFRNFPDVALTADNVFVIADGGVDLVGIGGTSCASPLWAGFAALINQQAANVGHSAIGFINPSLYRIASSANYLNCFNDTTTGNNTWSGSPSLYFAVANYDLCTGLGTPSGTNLINALTSKASSNTLTHISAPLPPYGANLATLNGSNPNGTWELFVQDDSLLNVGVISNGYWLTLTTANPVGFAADTELLMAAQPSTNVVPGSNVVCVLTVTNYGPSGSTNIIVSDSLPQTGVTLVSSSASAGTVTRSGSTVIWAFDNLAVNTGASLSLTLNFATNGSYLTSAQVTADTSDPNPDDGSPSLTFVVGTTAPPVVSASYINSSGAFLLSVTGSAPSIIVQASTNLTSWTDIYTSAPPFVFTTYDKTNYPARFYRALVGP